MFIISYLFLLWSKLSWNCNSVFFSIIASQFIMWNRPRYEITYSCCVLSSFDIVIKSLSSILTQVNITRTYPFVRIYTNHQLILRCCMVSYKPIIPSRQNDYIIHYQNTVNWSEIGTGKHHILIRIFFGLSIIVNITESYQTVSDLFSLYHKIIQKPSI